MHIRSVFMLVAVSTAAVAQANGILFETRPENVPADYLATPSGWFHPSCVIELGEEEKLDVNGNVVGRRDGLLRRSISRCVYPRFDRDGRQVLSNHPNPPPTVNGWLVAGAAFAAIAIIPTKRMPPSLQLKKMTQAPHFHGSESEIAKHRDRSPKSLVPRCR